MFMRALRLDELQTLIDKADSFYYRNGSKAVITDSSYDALKEQLKVLNPTDERLTRVGVPYSPAELRTKTLHTIPMGSLDNVDGGIGGYQSWYDSMCEKFGEKVVISATYKIDGASTCAVYRGGVLQRVVTRGNGMVGEDITANAVNFRGIPTVLSEPIDIDVRGEVILYVSEFKKMEAAGKTDSNPRNVGNGILGRDNGVDSDKIQFIAFNAIRSYGPNEQDLVGLTQNLWAREEWKLTYLQSLGFQTPPHKTCTTVEEFRQFYDEVLANRANLKFEIDGIVVVLDSVLFQNQLITPDPKSRLRPKYAKAVKFPSKSNVTVINDVIITVGHNGVFAPTAVLEKVRIGGVDVTHALLNNWDEIERLGVAIGDTVEVILAGDIIPKVISVVQEGANRQPILEPKVCPTCGGAASRNLRGEEGAMTFCTNSTCPSKALGKIFHWIGDSKKGVGILDLGDKIGEVLYRNGTVQDPADLYTLTVDQLKDLVLDSGIRVGHSRAKTIVDNISGKKQLTLPVFLGSLGIDLLGRRRVQILMDEASGALNKLENWLDEPTLRSLKVKGLGESIREAIIAGINDNRVLIQKLLQNGVSVVGKVQPISKDFVLKMAEEENGCEVTVGSVSRPKSTIDLSGKSFCFTGTRECLDEVEAAGGIIKSGISRGLNFLVQLDALSASKKTQKAEEYGVQIISIDFLKDVLAGKETLDLVEQQL